MRLSLRTIRGFRRDQSGAAAVEFAFVSIFFIALCVAVIEFGLALQTRNELTQAADRGIRFVVLNPEASHETVQTQVEGLLSSYDSDSLLVEVGTQTINSTEYRTISIDYDIQVWVPGMSMSLFTLRAFQQVPIPS
jgi:Flp pilus assembly protein TadG